MTTPGSSYTCGQPLRGEAREIDYKVAEYWKGMRQQYNMQFNVTEDTSRAIGIGQTHVNKSFKKLEHCGNPVNGEATMVN